MDNNGEVQVSFRSHPVKTNFVIISVIDKGCGIERKNIERIFEPYYSTKKFGMDKGTGLGMSIAYSIVKSHMGEILIGSAPGKGTRVDIILPVSQAALNGQAEKSFSDKIDAKQNKPLSGKKEKTVPDNGPKSGFREKVLVMDDDTMILEMSAKVLDRLGYEAVTAKNGEQAIQQYRRSLKDKAPIKVVILDLEVKQGMGGAQAIKELQLLDPDVQAIIASGYSSDRVMENCQDYGFAVAIAKPYSMDALKKALQTLSSPITS